METVVKIRNYRDSNAVTVGRLIARTYAAFNLGFATADEQVGLLGPFHFAESMEPARQTAIAQAIAAPLVLVAEEADAIVAVLRAGRVDQRQRAVLQSLFVDGSHHRRGIGRQLVGRFSRPSFSLATSASRGPLEGHVAVHSRLCGLNAESLLGRCDPLVTSPVRGSFRPPCRGRTCRLTLNAGMELAVRAISPDDTATPLVTSAHAGGGDGKVTGSSASLSKLDRCQSFV